MKAELVEKQKLSNKEIIMELFDGKRRESHLTDFQKEYLLQVRSAYSMILAVRSKKYIVSALIMQFKISLDKAYRIIRECSEIFADVGKVDKEIHRHTAIEMAKQSYRKAKKAGSTRDMVSATTALIKAAGLDREDADLPDFEKLNPSLIINVLPEGMEDQIQQLLSGGAVNLNNIPAESIPYEEVEEENTGRADQS
jgi:hypothetical protein